MLPAKYIAWNPKDDEFVYQGRPVDFRVFADAIVDMRLRQLGQWCVMCLSRLEEYSNAVKIADILENALDKIDRFDVEDDVALQLKKRQLHQCFIHAAAGKIKEKTFFQIPSNTRGLDVASIKEFINEVFLKQQLLDYGFRTLRPRQLSKMPSSLLHGWLARQQRIRQLDVVQTSRYIFALAPSLDKDVNIYSIRRFLSEETLIAGGRTYLNGAVIETARLMDETAAENFRRHVEGIVTIEGMVGKVIIDLVMALEDKMDSIILPALFVPLEASQANLARAIDDHLRNYESLLNEQLLEPLANGLTTLVGHQDECEYLYIASRQLLGDVISSFLDFQMLPALLGNTDAERMMARLSAYAGLLKKRRSETFVLMPADRWLSAHRENQKPLQELRTIIKAHAAEYLAIKKLADQQRTLLEKPATFFDKLFKRKQKQESDLQLTLKKVSHQLWQAHMDVLRLARQYKDRILRVEFEAMLSISGTERSFAFAAGNNGISRLPVLHVLPAHHNALDLSALDRQLTASLAKM